MKTALVLIIAILAQASGNMFLSRGMKHIAALNANGTANLAHVAMQAVESPTIWIGTLLLMVFLALYATGLSWADLSFVLPATSFGYVVNVAFAHYFLNEPVSLERWAGTVFIAIGVLLVSRTGQKSKEAA